MASFFKNLFRKEGDSQPVPAVPLTHDTAPSARLSAMPHQESAGPFPFSGGGEGTHPDAPRTGLPTGSIGPFSAVTGRHMTARELAALLPPALLRFDGVSPDQPIPLPLDALRASMEAGRPVLRLTQIHDACPLLFQRSVEAHEDVEITLPLTRVRGMLDTPPTGATGVVPAHMQTPRAVYPMGSPALPATPFQASRNGSPFATPPPLQPAATGAPAASVGSGSAATPAATEPPAPEIKEDPFAVGSSQASESTSSPFAPPASAGTAAAPPVAAVASDASPQTNPAPAHFTAPAQPAITDPASVQPAANPFVQPAANPFAVLNAKGSPFAGDAPSGPGSPEPASPVHQGGAFAPAAPSAHPVPFTPSPSLGSSPFAVVNAPAAMASVASGANKSAVPSASPFTVFSGKPSPSTTSENPAAVAGAAPLFPAATAPAAFPTSAQPPASSPTAPSASPFAVVGPASPFAVVAKTTAGSSPNPAPFPSPAAPSAKFPQVGSTQSPFAAFSPPTPAAGAGPAAAPSTGPALSASPFAAMPVAFPVAASAAHATSAAHAAAGTSPGNAPSPAGAPFPATASPFPAPAAGFPVPPGNGAANPQSTPLVWPPAAPRSESAGVFPLPAAAASSPFPGTPPSLPRNAPPPSAGQTTGSAPVASPFPPSLQNGASPPLANPPGLSPLPPISLTPPALPPGDSALVSALPSLPIHPAAAASTAPTTSPSVPTTPTAEFSPNLPAFPPALAAASTQPEPIALPPLEPLDIQPPSEAHSSEASSPGAAAREINSPQNDAPALIELSLRAVLRDADSTKLGFAAANVPESVRVSLPLETITRQLALGRVEVGVEDIRQGIAEKFRLAFARAEDGLRVVIPMSEVFHNLPDSAKPALGPAGAPQDHRALTTSPFLTPFAVKAEEDSSKQLPDPSATGFDTAGRPLPITRPVPAPELPPAPLPPVPRTEGGPPAVSVELPPLRPAASASPASVPGPPAISESGLPPLSTRPEPAIEPPSTGLPNPPWTGMLSRPPIAGAPANAPRTAPRVKPVPASPTAQKAFPKPQPPPPADPPGSTASAGESKKPVVDSSTDSQAPAAFPAASSPAILNGNTPSEASPHGTGPNGASSGNHGASINGASSNGATSNGVPPQGAASLHGSPTNGNPVFSNYTPGPHPTPTAASATSPEADEMSDDLGESFSAATLSAEPPPRAGSAPVALPNPHSGSQLKPVSLPAIPPVAPSSSSNKTASSNGAASALSSSPLKALPSFPPFSEPAPLAEKPVSTENSTETESPAGKAAPALAPADSWLPGTLKVTVPTPSPAGALPSIPSFLQTAGPEAGSRTGSSPASSNLTSHHQEPQPEPSGTPHSVDAPTPAAVNVLTPVGAQAPGAPPASASTTAVAPETASAATTASETAAPATPPPAPAAAAPGQQSGTEDLTFGCNTDVRQLLLRAVLGTDRPLSEQDIVDRCASLPGLKGCVLFRRDQAWVSLGSAAESAETLRSNAERTRDSLAVLADSLGLGSGGNFTLRSDFGVRSFFLEPGLCLAVWHDQPAFTAGTREKLILIAQELAKW